MAFPDLFPVAGQQHMARGVGIPVGGAVALGIPWVPLMGWDPVQVTEDSLEISMIQSPGAPGVTGVRFVSLSADKSLITVDFTQTAPGVGQCQLTCRLRHTIVR